MSSLKVIDLFGTILTFRVLDEEKFHSLISIILSIITFVATILFTYFFGLDFIFHTKSNVLQSTRVIKNYQYYNFKFEDLFFAWRIERYNNDEVNFTNFLFPKFTYLSYITGDDIRLKYEKCKNFNISFNIPNDIEDYFCSDISNFSFGGGWENDNEMEFFFLTIDTCKNLSCLTKEDFQKLIDIYGVLYLVIYYPTISFDPENDILYQINYNKKYIALGYSQSILNRFYIQKYKIEDDIGWILPNLKIKNIFGISNVEVEYFPSNYYINAYGINNYIYSANFYIDKKVTYYKRWFTKAYESLSIISAFYKFLYIIFDIISSFCNKFLLLDKIMINDNFDENNFEKFKRNSHSLEINNFPNNNNSNNILGSSKIKLRFINNTLQYQSNFISRINKQKPDCICNSKNGKGKDKQIISSSINIKEEVGIDNKDNNEFLKNSKSIKEYSRIITHKLSKNLNYKLLFIHCFHCLVTKKKKLQNSLNVIKIKLLKKKLGIENYLDLDKKSDLLFIELSKIKMLNNNVI